MGEWTVLRYWNASGDKYHDWHDETSNTVNTVMEYYKCWPVVKEHGSEPEAPPAPPEFDITLTHLTEAQAIAINKHGKGGWRYIIAWEIPAGHRNAGVHRVEAVYGFPTKDRAQAGAEYRADQIAEAYNQNIKYKYTPRG